MKDALLMLYVKTDCALKRMADRFHSDRRGAGTAEYAMIIGLAVLLGVGILRLFWTEISNLFNRIITALQGIV